MTAHYEDGPVQVWHGDCIDVMRAMPDNSVDAVVTDPPYGLEFMGKEWDSFKPGGKRPTFGEPDGTPFRSKTGTPSWGASGNPSCRNCGGDRYRNGPRKCTCDNPDFGNHMAGQMRAFQAWCEDWAREAYRLLKPGGHLLAFGGTRTFHRLASGIEDAGFEIRDSIAWLYGSGFPKSLDVSKAIDRIRDDTEAHAAVARFLVDQMTARGITRRDVSDHFGMANGVQQWTTIRTDAAVKPRVPNVEQWGELRTWLDLPDDMDAEVWRLNGRKGTPGDNWADREVIGTNPNIQRAARSLGGEIGFGAGSLDDRVTAPATADAARWDGFGTALKPAFEPIVVARKPLESTVAGNVLKWGTGALNIDASRIGFRSEADKHANDVAAPGLRDSRSGFGGGMRTAMQDAGRWPANVVLDEHTAPLLDAQSGDRRSAGDYPSGASTAGLFGQRQQGQLYADAGGASRFFYTAKASTDERPNVDGIAHPTVKPVDLMRWLVKLVTPPGGVVLEPFAGSGTTVEACVLEGFHCIAIEREADYLPLILKRIRKPHAVGLDFGEWEA